MEDPVRSDPPATPRGANPLSDAASVPVGPCPGCQREVLAYLAPAAPRASGRYACVHCDRALRHVDWVDENELAEVGYEAWDPLAGGCGTGCAAGGCGVRR